MNLQTCCFQAQAYGQQAYSPYDQTHTSQSTTGAAQQQQLAQYAPTGVPPVAYGQTSYAAQAYSQQTGIYYILTNCLFRSSL
jgi:hypothetical protein